MTFARPINDQTPRITQGYSASHKGVDYGYPDGKPVYASASGKVTIANKNETRQWIANTASDPYKPASGRRNLRTEDYGNFVKIDHGNGYSTLYAHLKHGSIGFGVGEYVHKGMKIGEVGSTGNSTGNHLHWEIRQNNRVVNPVPLLDTDFTDYGGGEVIPPVKNDKTITIEQDLFEELVGKATKYDAFFNAGYSDIRVVSRRINELEKVVGEKQLRIDALEKELANVSTVSYPVTESTSTLDVTSVRDKQGTGDGTKPFWKSKTVLANAAALVGLAVDYFSGSNLIKDPETAAVVIAGLNIILRFLSSQSVTPSLRAPKN